MLITSVIGMPAIGASPAEELTKRLPDGVIGFVATSGGDALKGDFNKTALGRICNDPGVRKFVEEIKAEVKAKAGQDSEDPNVSQEIDQVVGYVKMAISRPILLGVSQVPIKEGPPVGAFAILDAGNRKTELAAAVTKLEAMTGEEVVDANVGSLKVRQFKENEDFPLYWGWIGNYFVIAANDAQGAAAKYVSQPRSTAPAYLSKVPANGDAVLLHFDYQTVSKLIEKFVRDESGDKDAGTFAAAMKGLGLNELRSLTARVGFAGTDVVAQSVLEMPKPTGGIFAACRPIELGWLRVADARAVTASAFNWDAAGLYDTIMNTVKGVMPEDEYSQMQEMISGIESQINVRIRGDLLASLAGPTVFYAMPAGVMPEAPMGGFVVLAKLKDPGAFEKSLNALGEFAAEQANGMLQIGSETREDGRVVHVWAIPPLAIAGMTPNWSIVNDHVVLGSSEVLCDQGVVRLSSKAADANSILGVAGFKQATSQLPKEILGFTYTDSQVQFNQMMTQMRQFWPMAVMAATQAGFKLPTVLPSLTQIAKDMGPSVSYSYYGSDGLYSYNRGPGIEITVASVAGGAVGAAVALPALARAREQARIVASMSNLKQIGLALHMYADTHDGKFPSDLEAVKSYLANSTMPESPRKPKDFEGPSYIYVPDQSQSGDPGNIVAYENPEFAGDDIVALFLDGHVEKMSSDRFQSELEATYENLGRPMPGQGTEDEEGQEEDQEDTEDEDNSGDEEETETPDTQPVVFAMPGM